MYKEGTVIEIKLMQDYKNLIVKDYPHLREYIPPMSMNREKAVIIRCNGRINNFTIYDIEIEINGIRRKRRILGIFTRCLEMPTKVSACPKYQPINKEEEKEKEIMNENIVKLWNKKTKDKLLECRDLLIKDIEDSDVFIIRKKELENEIKTLLINDGNNEKIEVMTTASVPIITKESIELINSIEEKYQQKIRETENKVVEVLTMIEDCEHYEQSIEILEQYDIVDNYGKLKITANISDIS